jgi:hypothetical protein
LLARHVEGFVDGDYAQFLPLVVDDEDFADADSFVDAEIFSGYGLSSYLCLGFLPASR